MARLLARALSSRAFSSSSQSVTAAERVITYGKYKGEKLGSLPDRYLRSMLKKPLWAEFVKEVLDERLPKPGVGRVPLVFSIGKRSPLRSGVVSFEFGAPRSCEQEHQQDDAGHIEAGQVEEENDEQEQRLGRRRHTKLQKMPAEGILQAELLEEETASAVSSDGSNSSREEPQDLIAESESDEEASSEEEDTDSEIYSMVMGKHFRDRRRTELCDELRVMAQEEHPFSAHQMDKLLEELESEQIKLDSTSNGYLLYWCGELGNAELAERLHRHIMKTGQTLDRKLRCCLVQMYGKCKRIRKAREIFEGIKDKGEFAWATMVTAYAGNGLPQEALSLLAEMDMETALVPNVMCFVSSIRACGELKAADKGRDVHEGAIACKLASSNNWVGMALLEMYAACGCLEDARDAFDAIKRKDLRCYNAMLAVLGRYNEEEAQELYRRMDLEGVKPDRVTYTALLNGCKRSDAQANEVYRRAAMSGFAELRV